MDGFAHTSEPGIGAEVAALLGHHRTPMEPAPDDRQLADRPTPPNLANVDARLADLAELDERYADDPTAMSWTNRHAAAAACARDCRELLAWARAIQRWADDIGEALQAAERAQRETFADLQHFKSIAIVAQRVNIGGGSPPQPAVRQALNPEYPSKESAPCQTPPSPA